MLNILEECEGILITAGAGMGVDSGLPDFRGDEGFWKAYPPLKKLGIDFISMANPQWFYENPELAWAFYGHRLNLYRKTIPHNGFEILLELAKQKNNYFIYTSNVDGQFQKAGFEDSKIVEIHGSIHYLQCSNDCNNKIFSNDLDIDVDINKFKVLNIPLCECGAVLRPNILMFGDWLWNGKRTNSQISKFNKWVKQNRNKKIVLIEIGAGMVIPTIRKLGDRLSKQYPKWRLIRINPRDYEVSISKNISIDKNGLAGIKCIFE